MKRGPEGHVNPIQRMPVGIQRKGNCCVEGGIANDIGSQWTGEQTRKGGKLLGHVRVASYPDRLSNDHRQSRDAAYCDTSQHHLMRGNERPVTSTERVPLDIQTGPNERADGTKQTNKPAG